VRGLGDSHDLSGDLGIEMRGHRNARRSSNGRCFQPARDAADPHEVRHHEVTGLFLEREVEVAGAVKILANLDRCLQLGSLF
jgi:hypothetical protein